MEKTIEERGDTTRNFYIEVTLSIFLVVITVFSAIILMGL